MYFLIECVRSLPAKWPFTNNIAFYKHPTYWPPLSMYNNGHVKIATAYFATYRIIDMHYWQLFMHIKTSIVNNF